ncbi:hypothetical protein AOA57_24680 [Pseudomonas sp. 2588-5]|nr:hypothetical protein AOA57_24680 [Pseudomonas sp. 2588-5]
MLQAYQVSFLATAQPTLIMEKSFVQHKARCFIYLCKKWISKKPLTYVMTIIFLFLARVCMGVPIQRLLRKKILR